MESSIASVVEGYLTPRRLAQVPSLLSEEEMRKRHEEHTRHLVLSKSGREIGMGTDGGREKGERKERERLRGREGGSEGEGGRDENQGGEGGMDGEEGERMQSKGEIEAEGRVWTI